MSDQMGIQLLVSAGVALLGLGFLAYSAWARHGGSPVARQWMGTEFGPRTRDERMTVLGAPMLGVMCLCFAASALPLVGPYLMIAALPVGALCLLLFLASLLWFVPLPDIIYPRWARPLRARNRAAEAQIRSALRRR
ncbi:hypothetical protein [Brachybacterium sp. YJGR34]|uniref:hypothetical protein n=1 Tax=Brachybacterium sp. YJGR34 TaxID=2059911 RepID=UPI000E0B44EE|nr:hypothetical protein [Brachybacterium sp. YJGR34]